MLLAALLGRLFGPAESSRTAANRPEDESESARPAGAGFRRFIILMLLGGCFVLAVALRGVIAVGTATTHAHHGLIPGQSLPLAGSSNLPVAVFALVMALVLLVLAVLIVWLGPIVRAAFRGNRTASRKHDRQS